MSGESLEWLDEYWRRKREHLSLRRDRTREVEAGLNGHSRSGLVFQAAEPNRYRLAHVAIKAARRFHVSTERMETTVSDSLRRIGDARDHGSPQRDKGFQGSSPAPPREQRDCASEVEQVASNEFGAA